MNSTGAKNAALGALKTALEGNCFGYVYGGVVPADANAAPASPTILAKIFGDGTSTGCTFQAAAGGVLAKTIAENWGGAVLANGTATFIRWCHGSDDGSTLSTTAVRIQSTVGLAGFDVNLDNITLTTSGSPVSVGAYELDAN